MHRVALGGWVRMTLPQATPRAAVPGGGARPDGDRRADIEGLRAVAVLLVLLYHAAIGGVTGGFVGVDVFFVISGFLITGLLLREVQRTGTISLSNFYARRVRRLLPAAALVLLVTLAASVALVPPLLVPGIAADTAMAALYVSNIGFAVQATDYFAAGQAPSPILHFWSLGVEEQFYLFWPAIVLLVARGALRPGRRVGAAMVVIAVTSFAFSAWLTSAAEPWAFFSLPARAWELALGGLLAVAGSRLRLVPRWAGATAGWLGLGLIALAGMTFGDTTPFPGVAALLPTVGAALVLVSGTGDSNYGPARLLGTALPRYIGRISYSLYLWHWPLLVLPAVALGSPLPLWERASLAGLSILLAAGTHRWVEDPLRRGRLIGTLPRRNLAMAGALTLSVAIASASVDAAGSAGLHGGGQASTPAQNALRLDTILNGLASQVPAATEPGGQASAGSPGPTPPGPTAAPTVSGTGPPATVTPSPTPSPPPERPPTKDAAVPSDLQPALGSARQDLPQSYFDHCHTQEESPPSTSSCLYGDVSSSTTIALFGDSHALSWFPAVERLAESQDWRLLSLTMSACSPADMLVWNPNFDHISTACATWRAQALDRIVRAHPAVVLVAGTRGFQVADSSGHVLTGDARTRAWEAGMKRTLARLIPAAGQVIILADAPLSRTDPPVCLSQHPTSTLACDTPVALAINDTWLGEERHVAAMDGVGFIDPTLWICPSSPCPVVLGDLLVYRDAGHLTATFAAALSDRLQRAVLGEVARRKAGLP